MASRFAGMEALPSSVLTPEQQRALAERVRGREASAEEELVQLFWRRISYVVLFRTRDPEIARDLTQDVLFAVVTALRRGDLRESERLASFVYGTARNVINNYLRDQSRAPRLQPLDAASKVPCSPMSPDDGERIGIVRRALAALDSIDRQIMMLTLVHGLKPGEIAIRLGLTGEVVRTRKSRALKKVVERVKQLSRI